MAGSVHSIRRVFIAVDLDDEVRHGLVAHLAAGLGDGDLPGRPVPAVNWHFTLRFLGSIGQPGLETLLASLDEAELGPSFRLAFGGLGAFPRESRATVLWLGTGAGSDALVDLAGAAEGAAVTAGFTAEERPFHPHLTLSRLRPPRDVTALVQSIPVFPLRQSVTSITVLESHLGGGPARYERLEEFRLG